MIVPPPKRKATPLSAELNNADPTVIANIKQMCIERFEFFTIFVLKKRITEFHADMIRHQLSTPHSMVLAPRGGGKSTVCDVAYVLWLLIQKPNLRICIASKSGPQAEAFLGEIKAHMESNSDFRLLFGDLVGPTWNDSEIVISTRTAILKEPTILTKSVGAGIPGGHFDIIIADDLCDLENTATEHQRNKMHAWFYTVLLPTLEPHGELRVIGTRYHAQDLYGHFAKKDKHTGEYADKKLGPNVFVVPALVPDYDNLDEDGKPTEKSFWPDYFTVEFLKDTRHNAGMAIFALQYQNDASITDGGIIKLEDVEPYVYGAPGSDIKLPALEDMWIFQGADPAISQKQEADFFAHCTIGICKKTYHIFVLEIVKKKITFNAQVDFIINRRNHWDPQKVGIETNAYQQALAQAVTEKAPWLPVHELKTRKDKVQRAKILSAFFERHEIHFHYKHIEAIECCVGMPSVEHDDLFDALDIAVDTAKHEVIFDSVVAIMPTNFRSR